MQNISKRLLSLVMAILMVVSLFPANALTAFAATEEASQATAGKAELDGVEYATFAAAVGAIGKNSGEHTIKLLANDATSNVMVGHQFPVQLTVDLNGFTLSSAGTALTSFRSGTVVTLTNGTVSGNSSGGGTLGVSYGGKLVLGKGVTVTGASGIKVQDGTLLIEEPSVKIATKGNAVTQAKDEANITLKAGTYSSEPNEKWIPDETGYEVIKNSDGTWTVQPPVVVNTNTGVQYPDLKTAAEAASAGDTLKLMADFNVKNVILGHQKAVKITIDLNGKKLSSADKTLTIYRGGTEVTLINGTVTGNSSGGTIAVSYNGKLILGDGAVITGYNALKVDAGTSLIVNGKATVTGRKNAIDAQGSVVITAGTFSHDPSAYVPSTHKVVQNGSTYTVTEIVHEHTWVKGETVAPTFDAEGYTWYTCSGCGETDKQDPVPALVAAAAINGTKYATLQAAINAAVNGDTITLLADVTENVTVTEAAGKYITIDGNGKTMNGNITVKALSDTNDNRRITIQNVRFENTADTGIDFITSVETNHYPRITVKDCQFIGNGKGTDVALRLKSSHSVVIDGCSGSGLHSFLQNTSGWNLTIIGVTVIESKGGLALGTVQGVTVKGCNIETAGYGIRLDAETYNNNAVIEDCTIEAFVPVVIRKANTAGNITIKGTNTMTAENNDGKWLVIGKTEYEAGKALPTDGQDLITVTLSNPAMAAGVHGRKITGSITPAFSSSTAIWGEGGGNAYQSLVVELYEGQTLIATASLKNVGGIIDGDVYVTWNIPFTPNGDSYWDVQWLVAPSVNMAPDKVVMIIDGKVVATNNVQLNGPDDLNKIVAAATKNGEFVGYFTKVSDAIAAGDKVYVREGNSFKQVVAVIGETGYETIAAAITAAKAGDTVKILPGTYDYALKIDKSDLTVIGLGQVTLNGVPSIKGTNYKIENIDFVYGTGSTNLSGSGLIKNCSFTATNSDGNTFRYCYGVKNAAIAFEGCELNAPGWAVHFDSAPGLDLTFTDCKITGRVALGGDLGSLTATGTTFKNGYVNVWGTEDEATFNACAFENVPYIFTGYDADNTVNFNDCADNVLGLIYGGNDAAYAKIYVDGVLKSGAAKIGNTYYATLAEALTAAQNGDIITLVGSNTIAMNGKVYGKTVTITGTAKVDWSKGFLFVGRGGAGNGTVIFEGANLTSASNSASYGIHVSGREKNTADKYDGTLIIKNSTIELDYLINKGAITLDNSTLTVKNGTAIGGRPASETESGVDATATVDLTNGSKLVVNNHNGMGLGYEAIGILNVDATSTFETTQSFLVTAKGTLNLAGKATIAGTLTNNGSIVLTDKEATLTSSQCSNVTSAVTGYLVDYKDGKYYLYRGLKGQGTAADPYLIENVSDLEFFRASVNAGETKYNAPGVYVALAADIDMNGATWERGIGDGINATFDGIFDGNNKTIKNLNLAPKADSDGYLCGGLFGYTFGAVTIKNIVLENITVKSDDAGHNVGALVGFAYNKGGKLNVSNVTVKNVTIDTPNTYGVGAIVGYSYGSMGTIENCVVDGATITGYSFVGGITGYSYSNAVITNNTVKNATITATSKGAGGIAGLALTGDKVIGNTVENTTVTASTNAASVIGELGGDGVVVQNNNAAMPQVGGGYATGTPVEAKIGDVYFATIEKAVAAANEGETIELLVPYVVAADETVELDLTGKTVVYTSNVAGEAMITVNGELTLTGNGKIVYTYNGEADTAYSKGNYTVANRGKLIVNGATIENATAQMKHASYAVDNYSGSELVLNSGLILNTNNYAVRMFSGGNVTVNGGEIKGTRAVWMQAAGSNTADAPAMSLTVNGGKLTALGETGYKLAVYSYNYGNSLKNVNITVNGGVIDGDIALSGGKNKTVAENVTITGGELAALYSYAADEVAGETVNVSGGTFTAPVEEVYCAAGYIPTENTDGTYGVKSGKYVARINGVGYETIEAAIKAAKAGETVTILEGTYAVPSMKAGITIEGQGNVVLNGTLTGTLENLTLKNLHIKGGNAQRWAYAKGDLVFENVTFEATSVYALHFDGITAGATLTYKDCTIIGWAAMSGSPASCVFEGCTFKGNGTYGLIRTYFDATIENCTFDVANVNTTDVYQDGIHAVEGATVTVNNSTNVNGEMEDLINIHAMSVVVLDGKEIKHVAKVGGNYYRTLQEAFAAAGLTGTVTLVRDVDLAGAEWTPVDFNGVFDGNGHTISNLVVNGAGKSNQGFFGTTQNGEIKNVTFENAKVTGRLNVGVVAGQPYTSKYTNIKVTGHVEVNGMAYVGGVGGKNAYANWTDITVDVDATSYVKANSVENGTAYRTYVGGVVGFNGEGGHTFKNISSNIKVIGSTCDIGGLFGIAHYGNKFENVTFTGSVEAPADAEEVGGIAGVWHNEKGTQVTFNNVTSTGTVTVGTETTESIVGGAYNAANETILNSGALYIEGKEVWLKVAKVNGTSYQTLEEALAAGSEIEILSDLTANVAALENVTLFTNVAGGVTITNEYANYVDFNNVTLKSGVTLKTPAVFSSEGVNVIEGAVKTSSTFYHAYDSKTTIQNGGKIEVGGMIVVRYNENADSGIYVYGDGNAETVEVSCADTIGTYSGTFYAEDAVIKGNMLWLDYKKGSSEEPDKYAPINAQFVNSVVEITKEFRLYKDACLTVTGSTVTADTVQVRENADPTVNVDSTSSFKANAVLNLAGATINAVKDAEGNVSFVEFAAKIGTTFYATLEDALKAVKADETITLVRDITVTGKWDCRSNGAKITASNVTIDGAGKKITFTGEISDMNWNTLFRAEGDIFTVKNLTIDASAATGMQRGISAKGSLVVDNCTFIGNGAKYGVMFGEGAGAAISNVTATITNSKFINWGRGISDNANAQNAKTVTVTGNSFENASVAVSAAEKVTFTGNTVADDSFVSITSYGSAITMEVVATGNTMNEHEKSVVSKAVSYDNIQEEFTVKAAVAVSNDTETKYFNDLAVAIAAAKAGDVVTLNADAKASAVILIDKSLTINGNGYKVTSGATRVFRVTTANVDVTLNDVNMVNTAVRVGTNDIRGISIDDVNSVKLTLNNCSVDFTDASACDWAYAVNLTGGSNNTLTVNGGTYEGANVINVRGAKQTVVVKDATLTSLYPNNDVYYGACIYVVQNAESSVEATGNTFNGSNAVAINAGYTPVTESNNTDNTTLVVAKIGNTYYTSLAAAFAAAQDGDTVKLLRNVSVDSETYTIADGKSVTLDMNGKKITVTDNKTGNYELFYIYGEMTVTGNGTIVMSATNDRDWNASSSIFHNRGGVLNIENGTFTHEGGTDMAYVVDNSGNWYGDATTNIKAGTLTSSYIAIRNRMEQNEHGASGTAYLNVYGGTINGTSRAIWAQAASTSTTAPATGVINITGGEIGLIDTARSAGAESMTTISGGNVAAFKGEASELTVTGGTLSQVTIMNASGEVIDYVITAEGLYIAAAAKIGTTNFATVAEAFAAAQAGDEVVILAAGQYAVPTGKSITITGAVEGVEFTNIGACGMNGASVTFNNVTFTYAANSTYKGLQHSGNMVYNNCTINGQVFLYGQSETFNNCTFNNTGDNYNVWTYTAKEVAFNNCTFNSDGKSVLIYAEGANVSNDVTVTNSTFNATAPVAGKAAIEMDSSLTAGINLVVNNSTATGFGTGNVSGNSLWNNKKGNNTDANNDITVIVNGETVLAPVTFVAYIGKIGYTSFVDAFAAAQDGDTITMLAPVVVAKGETLELNKAVTITYTSDVAGEDMFTNRGTMIVDGATLIYNNTDTTASNVTVSTISSEAGSVLEIKSGVVKNDSANNGTKGIYAFAIDLLTNGNLGDVTATISGGEVISTNYMAIRLFNNGTACTDALTVTGGYIYGAKRAIQIHMDNNAAELTISGGKIEADEGGYALCLFPKTATKIAISGGEFIGTVYSGSNGIISGGIFSEPVYEGYCAAGYIPTEYADGTFGVKEGKYVARVNGVGYETIEAAIKAAKTGETVTILEGTYTMPAMKAGITIEGQGNVVLNGTLSGTLENLTLKNLHIKGANAQRWAYAKGDLVFENVTFEATSVYALHFDGIAAGTNLTYKNCTIIGWAAMGGSPASCVFEGCTFKGNGTYGVIRTYFDATIENCTFDVAKVNTTDVYQDGIHAVGGATVTVNNSTNVNGDMIDVVNVGDISVVVLDGVEIKNVAKIGDNYYRTLQAAFAAAQAGETIILVTDIALAHETIKVNGNVTLDLNGKTLSGVDTTSKNYGLIQNNGTLTINDTVGTGKITVSATINSGWNRYSAVISNNPGGTLTVNGGTIEHLGGTDMAYGIDSLTNGNLGNVSVTINGGTIKSTYRGIRQFLNSASMENALVINGGTIEGANKSIFFHDPSKNANNGKLIVGENATLNGDVYLFVTAGSTDWPVEVSIANAAVTGNVISANVPENKVVVNNGTAWAVIDAEACVNGVGYATFAEAVNAAAAGDEVKILKAGTYKVPTGKDLTITGTVANVVFDNIGACGMNGASVTFNNVTFDYYPNVNYTGLQHSGNLVYNNCTINGQVFLYGQSETFNNCTFNQNSADAYNVWTYSAKEVAFNECTFNCAGKSVLIYAENASICNKVTVNGSTFVASAPVDGKAAIEMDSSLTAGINLVINNTTVSGFGTGNVSGNSLWNNKKGNYTDANNDITVIVDGETVLAPVTFVAYVGTNGYLTLAAAVAAAEEGQTVEVVADVTTGMIKIEKAITIDLGGKTVTGTDKKVFEVYANATIKNGTINGVNRCVDTRTAVELTLADITLVADEYTTYGNPQPLTIGGSVNGTKVTMTNTTISAATGYGIITFVETDLTATDSTISGYNALYVKPGSENSVFNFVNTVLSGSTIGNDVDGNSFSTIAVRANNVTVNVDANSSVNAEGNYCYALSLQSETGANGISGAKITVACDITGNIVPQFVLNNNAVYVKAEYADALKAKGFAISKPADGLVKIIAAVDVIDDWGELVGSYLTLHDAIAAAKDEYTLILKADINVNPIQKGALAGKYDTIYLIERKAITIDLNGHEINATADGSSLLVGLFATDNGGHLTIKDRTREYVNQTGEGKVTLKAGTGKIYAMLVAFEDGASIEVLGGNFYADKVSDSLIYTGGSENIIIDGGKYILGNVGETGKAGNYGPWIFNAGGRNDGNVIVKNGTFNADVRHQYWVFEAQMRENIALKQNADGTWTTTRAVAYVLEKEGNYTNMVGYATLEEAVAVCRDGKPAGYYGKNYPTQIVMLRDVTLTETLYIPDNVKIDMNGCTITGEIVKDSAKMVEGVA